MSVIPHIEEPPRTTGLGFSPTRVKIRNDQSIAFCDVERGPFPLLVGRDGLGTSSFLDPRGTRIEVNQLASDGRPIRVVGIEEPETALHPAAAGALIVALRDAATQTQVLVTTPSADLLERCDPEDDRILAVRSREGRTEIAPISRAGREAIQEHLFSAGELLRMGQPDPDWSDIARQRQSCFPAKPDERP